MLRILDEAIKKLKNEILAKVLYDLLKAIAIALLTPGVLYILSRQEDFNKYINDPISTTRWNIVFYCLASFIGTAIAAFLLTRKRIGDVQKALNTDELTGLPNHKALSDELKEAIDWAKQKEENVFSVILLGIDDFAKLNSQFGQRAADEILKKVGVTLKSDNRITDRTYRKSTREDRFVIIAKQTNLTDAVKAATRKKKTISEADFKVQELSENFHITVSCGVTEYDRREDDAKGVLDRATEAMVMAKQTPGKNAIRSYI